MISIGALSRRAWSTPILTRGDGSTTPWWDDDDLTSSWHEVSTRPPVMVRVTGDLDEVLVARVETLIAVLSDVRQDS